MSAPFLPKDEEALAALISEARGQGTTLRIQGGGTRQRIGRATNAAAPLSTAGLTGVTLYEPSEMVIGARAGTPLAEIEAVLAAKGQMLPFEPMDHRLLLGSSGEPSIGAIAAGNISGPRRISAGAARDSLIGVRFVNGRAEIVKSGGRVMKNVTGLDLVKLLSGSWGTLGVLTEVVFKVLPRPEAALTLVFAGLADVAAVALLSRALGSPFEVSGAAHLPAGVGDARARTCLRLEGVEQSLRYRADALRKLLAEFGAAALIEGADSATLWAAIRDAAPLAEPRDAAIWKFSLAPSKAARAVAAVAAQRPLRALYDWGGGLVWLAVEPGGDAGAGAIRAAVKAAGGHATLVRDDESVRARLDVFEPLDPALAALVAGLKKSFDPDGVLNPGLIYAGV